MKIFLGAKLEIDILPNLYSDEIINDYFDEKSWFYLGKIFYADVKENKRFSSTFTSSITDHRIM